MMIDDDKDNKGDIDSGLLTLSGPFSASFQSAGGRAQMFSALICGAFNKTF